MNGFAEGCVGGLGSPGVFDRGEGCGEGGESAAGEGGGDGEELGNHGCAGEMLVWGFGFWERGGGEGAVMEGVIHINAGFVCGDERWSCESEENGGV